MERERSCCAILGYGRLVVWVLGSEDWLVVGGGGRFVDFRLLRVVFVEWASKMELCWRKTRA